jgi:hypothetical protein
MKAAFSIGVTGNPLFRGDKDEKTPPGFTGKGDGI